MSVVTTTGISWKSALGGAFVAFLSMAPMIWRLTRQSRIPSEETPTPKYHAPLVYMAVGSAATIGVEWIVFFLCRKSRRIWYDDPKAPEDPEFTPDEELPMIFQPKFETGKKGDPEEVALPANQGSNGRCDAKCQAPTTYTSIRGVRKPKFLPLPEHSWG